MVKGDQYLSIDTKIKVHTSCGCQNAEEGVVHKNTLVIDKDYSNVQNRTCGK